MKTTVTAEGAGSIAVGGDAINSIFVTGGANQFFIGQYERLVDAYLNPQALYRELQIDRFVGREWLVRAIDEFIASVDRGYVVLEAEAGMGKTAFMAWIARKRRYLHHFVRLMPDASDIGVGLRNLSAQLIRTWDLRALAVGGVLPTNASRPDFFEEALYSAAEKRDEIRPGEPIVLAIDGLNEAAVPTIGNPLGLPAELPPGVYIVVSQRTVHVPMTVMTPRRVLRIRADSLENAADIRSYLDAEVARPEVVGRLVEAGVSPDSFARKLATRTAGVWLILRYVLAEIRNGARRPDDLDSLPVGLWQYYAKFWRDWQRSNTATWPTVDLPLLVTITAAQEPLPLELLCELSDCQDPDRAAELVGDPWRPFLHIQEAPDERYAVFHDSLREFTGGGVEVDGLTSAERAFVGRLAHAQQVAHQRIADRYLTAWGNLSAGLPALTEDSVTMDNGYGMRQLVHHLVRASSDEVLHGMLALERPRGEVVGQAFSSTGSNAWYEVHRTRHALAGYALDVERAWARAEEVATGIDAQPGARIDLELRYALFAVSVNSVAGNVPTDLLLQMMDRGIIIPTQAVELAQEITDARSKAEALTALVPRLTGDMRGTAQREALASVALIPDGYWRAGELVRLASVADANLSEDMLRIAEGMRAGYERDSALRSLAEIGRLRSTKPMAAEELSKFRTTDPAAFAEQYRQRTRHGVTTLLAGAAAELGGVSEGVDYVEASRFVRSSRWRAELLTASARTAPDHTRADILAAALSISSTVGDGHSSDAALGTIATQLAARGDVDAALACVSDLHEPEGQASALFAIAAHTSAPRQTEIARRAVDAAMGVADAAVRGGIVRKNGAQAALAGAAAQERILASLTADWRAAALGAMAGATNRPVELLTQALDVAASVDTVNGAWVVADLIPRLPAALIGAARNLAAEIEPAEQRDAALAALASRYGEFGEAASATRLMSTISDPHWLMEAQIGAATGLAAAGQLAQAAEVAARIWSPPHRAEAMAKSGQVAQAFAIADTATDPMARVAVLLRIGAAGPRGAGRDALAEARSAVADVNNPAVLPLVVADVSCALAAGGGEPESAISLVARLPDVDRATALLPLAPHAGAAVTEMIKLARSLGDRTQRGNVLAKLTGPLVVTQPPKVKDHVREVLHLLAMGTREQLLQSTPDLMPGLVELAGSQGLIDLATAIKSACRWWP